MTNMKVRVISTKGSFGAGTRWYKLGDIYDVIENSLLNQTGYYHVYGLGPFAFMKDSLLLIEDCELIDVYRGKQIEQILHEDKV